jgi:hypothetical protein
MTGAASSSEAPKARGRSWLAEALPGIVFLGIGVGVILRPYVIGSEMPGDLGDARLVLALLEFFYRELLAVVHGHSANFLNVPFFYPWPRVTNFSETFWGNAEVYAVARALGAGELRAFQIWFVVGFVLTYILALVSFRKFGLAPWGAAAAAFLFAFPLPMTAQFGHPQLVYRLWVPPAILAFDRFLTRRSLRGGAACVLFIALQLAASIYLGLFLCMLLAFYGAALRLVGRDRLGPPNLSTLRSTRTEELVATGIVLALGVIVLTAVGLPYLDAQHMYGFSRSWREVTNILPRPGSYLLASASRLWPNLSGHFDYPYVWEQQLFPGISAIIPLGWFLLSKRARRRRPLASVMLGAVIALFATTILVGGHTLYWLIYVLPGFSAVRAVSRVIVVMMMPLAALFGLLIDEVTAPGLYRFPRRLVGLMLSGLLIAECCAINRFDSSPASWQVRLQAIEARLPKNLPPHAMLAIASPPLGQDGWLLPQIDAEVTAVTLGIYTLNGYSGNMPPTWRTMTTCGDIGYDIRAGQHFLAEHNLTEADVAPTQIVPVGFGNCDLTALGHDPTLQLGRTYRFMAGEDGNAFVGDGFSNPESWGRWTDAKNAFLFFTLNELPPGRVSVEVEANALFPVAKRKQEVTVTVNGRACGEFVLANGKQHAKAVCPAGALRSGANVLRFGIAHPTRPIDLNINHDKRHLGLGLQALALMPDY